MIQLCLFTNGMHKHNYKLNWCKMSWFMDIFYVFSFSCFIRRMGGGCACNWTRNLYTKSIISARIWVEFYATPQEEITSSIHIGKPELLRTQRHMENIGKSGSREEALSRLHSFISVITFIEFYTWWAHSVDVCTYLDDNFLLFCLCYCTSFNNGQEQLSSNKQALDSAALPRSSSSPCMHACSSWLWYNGPTEEPLSPLHYYKAYAKERALYQ